MLVLFSAAVGVSCELQEEDDQVRFGFMFVVAEEGRDIRDAIQENEEREEEHEREVADFFRAQRLRICKVLV